jgi:excisionase family DNA binding protein
MTTPQIHPAKQFLSAREFAALYGIGLTNTYALLKRGELRALKFGVLTRIRREDAEVWASNLPVRKPA